MPGGALDGSEMYIFTFIILFLKSFLTYFNLLFSFVGSKAEEHRGALLLSYPMENGIVKNWNDMERIWSYIYSREGLNCSGGEHAVRLII